MAAILTVQGGIIMQNRQIDGHGLYLSLLATYDDLYTRLLPESDVLALQQGVFVADEAELQRRLEDYGL